MVGTEDNERAAELEILRAVKAGEAAAYRSIVEKYQGRVYAMVYGMVRNREDAKDAKGFVFFVD